MINACVVGCGNIAPNHIDYLLDSKVASLYAVCDNDLARSYVFSEKYAVKAYYDFEDVISDPSIDCVHICLPHYLHVPYAIKALEAGKDVVLEKPVCMNLQELNLLEDASIKSGKKLCIMLQNRTNPCICKIKELMKADTSLGKLVGISGVMNWHRDAKYYESGAWRGKWATEGGGAVINQAVHLLDMIDYIGHVESIRANISTKLLDDVIEVEDTADAHMTLSNGAMATFYATNTFPVNRPFQLEVCFENAVLRYADNLLYYIKDGNAEVICNDIAPSVGKNYWGSGHKHVLNAFYNGEEYSSFEDAKHSAILMCKLYESAKSGKRETL